MIKKIKCLIKNFPVDCIGEILLFNESQKTFCKIYTLSKFIKWYIDKENPGCCKYILFIYKRGKISYVNYVFRLKMIKSCNLYLFPNLKEIILRNVPQKYDFRKIEYIKIYWFIPDKLLFKNLCSISRINLSFTGLEKGILSELKNVKELRLENCHYFTLNDIINLKKLKVLIIITDRIDCLRLQSPFLKTFKFISTLYKYQAPINLVPMMYLKNIPHLILYRLKGTINIIRDIEELKDTKFFGLLNFYLENSIFHHVSTIKTLTHLFIGDSTLPSTMNVIMKNVNHLWLYNIFDKLKDFIYFFPRIKSITTNFKILKEDEEYLAERNCRYFIDLDLNKRQIIHRVSSIFGN